MILVQTVVAKQAMRLFPSYLKEETANFAMPCIKQLMLLQLVTRSSSGTLPECFVAGNVSVVSKRK